MCSKPLFFTLFLLLLYPTYLVAEIQAPNFNFSWEQLEIFAPGRQLKEIDEKLQQKRMFITQQEDFIVFRYSLNHDRYSFPVFVQSIRGKVLDSFAKLPAYFLHDPFLEMLIKKLGKNYKYEKTDLNAEYIWQDSPEVKYIYSGTCTILCFPLYFTIIPKKVDPQIMEYRPLLDTMSEENL